MKQSKRRLALLLSLMLLLAALSGCGRHNEETKPAESVSPVESAEVPEAASNPEREHGERFEATIMIEGMEETVKLEHIRNETAGFAMDYDYESFVCRGASDRYQIVWGYDDPKNPENYLEVSYSPEDAETVADAVTKALSEDYEVTRLSDTLDGAGECIRLDASAVKGGNETAEVLQEVYIIPADDGCRVAAMRYIAEGSDGFGKRLSYMVHTITVMEAQGERSLTDEQALSAVKRYCYLSNPDLEGIVNAGEYPVSWEISEYSDEQIVILFHSYTGADVRYYVNPTSGDTYVTELVPAVSADEMRTDETLNLWDYVNWWQG